ncbi:hypothetical protein K3495_g3494 [Podosphaera aphanis]|nr:hypothetical protein K3495_g3494 [Podosphaera aphanis]
MPTDPTTTNPYTMNLDKLVAQYIERLDQLVLKDIEAKNIIVSRINPTICLTPIENMTAKQLYDNIAGTRQETATASYAAALKAFLKLRFKSTADEYIDSFLAALQNVNNAADSFLLNDANTRINVHAIGTEQASAHFVLGTKHVDWLAT